MRVKSIVALCTALVVLAGGAVAGEPTDAGVAAGAPIGAGVAAGAPTGAGGGCGSSVGAGPGPAPLRGLVDSSRGKD